MLKRIKSFLLAMLLALPLLSCDTCQGVDGSWTVMVWLDADNNLESFAMADFNEMEYGLYQAGLADPEVDGKIKIIVQVDRNPGYDNNTVYTGSSWSDTRRYRVRSDPDNISEWVSERLDGEMGEANMGDAAALKDFIEYCRAEFPAENYALILWNHGGGLMKKSASSDGGPAGADGEVSKNICTDYTDDDQLYTGEITDVLTSEQSVDFMGFDACLMGMIEVAYEYRPGVPGRFGADAICFSPAEEQSDGWDYVRILTRLGGADSDADTADPEDDRCYDAANVTACEFAELCAKEYADAGSTYGNNLQTQTAVDNTKVSAVKASMDAFASAIAQVPGYSAVLETIRGSGASAVTMNYFNESSQWLTWPYFDLYDFAERVLAADMSAAVNTASGNLMTAIKDFILYSYAGSGYTGFANDQNGLSFFFTDGDGSYSSGTYLEYQWWYTSLDTNSVSAGKYYGRLDFCEKGPVNGTVENWYELIMDMYISSVTDTSCWPDPAY